MVGKYVFFIGGVMRAVCWVLLEISAEFIVMEMESRIGEAARDQNLRLDQILRA
jgi:hypothetical protein